VYDSTHSFKGDLTTLSSTLIVSAIGESMSTGHYSSDNDTNVQRKSVSVTLCPSQVPNELDWLDLGLSCVSAIRQATSCLSHGKTFFLLVLLISVHNGGKCQPFDRQFYLQGEGACRR
jgi:hypothetical protein